MKRFFPLVAALCAFAASAVSDHSIVEFPRIGGETDDAPRFQRAVDACRGGGLLTVPGGCYTLAQTVFVTNLCSIEMSPGAHVKAVADMDWMVKINQMWQYNPKTAPKDVDAQIYNLSFRGGTLDADGRASCLSIDNYRHFTLENATFLNGRVYGVGIETEGLGYEMVARNLYFKTLINGLAGNTALFTKGGDSHYTDIVSVNYTTGFHVFGGGANWLTRVHVWGASLPKDKPGEIPEMLRNSVCFRIDGIGSQLRDCYADTGAIGYWIGGREIRMFGCIYFNNTSFGLNDVTIICQDGGTLWCEGGRFEKQTPETKLYAGSAYAKVYWGGDNVFPGFEDIPVCMIPPTTPLQSPPIDIGSARQLLLDDEIVAENTMRRIWHRPVRHAQPVVQRPLTGGVWYDGAAKRYVGWTDDGATRMVSDDGVAWRTEKSGGLTGFSRMRVVMDYDSLDGKRFKAFCCGKGGDGFVSASSDGETWNTPVRTVAGGDLAMVFYNPFTRYWGYSLRDSATTGNDYHESGDFFAGAKSRMAKWVARFTPVPTPWIRETEKLRGKTAEDLCEFGCVAYEGFLLGLAQVSSDIWFGFARNRWHWTFPRPDDGEAFLPQTRRNGDWDARALAPNPGVCVIAGDELRFYYSGDGKATGFATLRRDGFCSLQDGALRTKTLVFPKGDRLWANVDSRQGELIVRIAEQDGKNFGERRISGVDSTRFDVGAIESNNPFSLEFVSNGGAKLYSFWAGDADGCSGGYLAGGSPGSATLRDITVSETQ